MDNRPGPHFLWPELDFNEFHKGIGIFETTNRLDPVSVNYQQSFYPLPNRTPANAFDNSLNYQRLATEKREMNQYSFKGDHRISEKNSLFGRYTYQQWIQDNGNNLPIYVEGVSLNIFNLQNHNFVISDTHAFSPALISETRIAMARNTHTARPESYDQGWAQKLGLPDTVSPLVVPRVGNGMPGVVFGNYTQRASTGCSGGFIAAR